MPFGNEQLLAAINERHVLDKLSTDPQVLFGEVKPSALKDGEKILGARYDRQEGTLSKLFWGKDDPALAFVRYSMSQNFPDFWRWVKPTPQGLIVPGLWTVLCTWLLATWLSLPISDWLSERRQSRPPDPLKLKRAKRRKRDEGPNMAWLDMQ
jgi:hypothetical protein